MNVILIENIKIVMVLVIYISLNGNSQMKMIINIKYFSQSEFTEEKRLMIQNMIGINLTKFKNYTSKNILI